MMNIRENIGYGKRRKKRMGNVKRMWKKDRAKSTCVWIMKGEAFWLVASISMKGEVKDRSGSERRRWKVVQQCHIFVSR